MAKVVRLRKQRDTKRGKLVAGMLVSPKCKTGQALNRSSRAAGGTITEVSWVSFSPRLGTSGKVGLRLTPKKYKRGEILLALANVHQEATNISQGQPYSVNIDLDEPQGGWAGAVAFRPDLPGSTTSEIVTNYFFLCFVFSFFLYFRCSS
ncbi:hypothetical protein VCV18_001541 [Metarhizium anisopliae]